MDVSVYRRENSKFYWMKYYDAGGKLIRESTKTANKRKALQLAKKKEADLFKAQVPGAERLKLIDLTNAVKEDYLLNNRRSIDRIYFSIKHLNNHLNPNFPLINFTAQDFTDYSAYRLHIDGAKPATINRELSLLKRGYNLLLRRERITKKPYIKLLQEDNVREGFVEPDKFWDIVDELPDYLIFPAVFMYYTGWRKNEVLNLKWEYVNLAETYVMLPAELSKNKTGRVYYIPPDIKKLFEKEYEVKVELNIESPFVFLNKNRTDRVKDIRGAWKSACIKAGIPNLIPHDLRRSTVRNLIRAGVPAKVAQQITGHKTMSILERYNIVSEIDLKEASLKQMKYINSKGEDGNGQA